jgi:hypothetical protein
VTKYEPPTDDDEALREIHAYLFKPPMTGGKSRAEQLDNLLSILRSGKMSGRVLIWLGGGAMAAIGFYNTVGAALAKWSGQ